MSLTFKQYLAAHPLIKTMEEHFLKIIIGASMLSFLLGFLFCLGWILGWARLLS